MRRRRAAVLGVAILAVVAAIILALGGGGSGQSSPSGREVGTVPAGSHPEQRCVDNWNKPENLGHQLVRAHLRAAHGQNTSVNVSVGFSAEYPDRCLIVVSAFEGRQNSEFLEGGGIPGLPYSVSNPNRLSPSEENWNASANPDGTLTLDIPRGGTSTLNPPRAQRTSGPPESDGTSPLGSSCVVMTDHGNAGGLRGRNVSCSDAQTVVRAWLDKSCPPTGTCRIDGYTCHDRELAGSFDARCESRDRVIFFGSD